MPSWSFNLEIYWGTNVQVCKKMLSALKFGKLQFVNCMFEVAGRGMFAGRRPRTDATTKEIINTSGYEDYLHVVVENITASMKYARHHY